MTTRFNRLVKTLALAGASVLLFTGCTQDTLVKTPIPETTLGSAQVTAVNEAVATALTLSNSTEAVIGVWSAGGDYVSTHTTENGRSIDADALFRGAQTLQPMMCAAVLDQVTAGKITLDRELSREIPRQTGIGNVTYRELCEGTSGLPDFKAKFQNIYLENPARPWASGELISESLINDKLSWPGLDVHRSDTNAVLLGRALTVLGEGNLNEFLQQTIFTPANMASTFIPEKTTVSIAQENSLHGIGYLPGPNCEAGIIDFDEVSTSILGNAGNTVTTVTDIKNFYEHLFAGTFGGMSAVETLKTTKPSKNPERDENGDPTEEVETTSHRGFGVLNEGPLWGYDGALPGSATAAWHNPDTGFTIVVALNNSASGASFASNLAFEIADLLNEPGLPWTAEEQAAKMQKAAVCQEE